MENFLNQSRRKHNRKEKRNGERATVGKNNMIEINLNVLIRSCKAILH